MNDSGLGEAGLATKFQDREFIGWNRLVAVVLVEHGILKRALIKFNSVEYSVETVNNQQLKQVGLKVTMPRLKVLQILERSTQHHLSAEDVYKSLLALGDDVGLATVYRVLTQFEAAGLVTRHNFEGGHSVFELDQGEHHDHLVCVKCGIVEEFVDELIEQRQIEIAARARFKMTDHSLNIYGLCPKCQ